MHLSSRSICSHFHEIKHAVSTLCTYTYTLYVNTTYFSEDTFRENKCASLSMSLKNTQYTINYPLYPKLHHRSRRLIWVCVGSEQKAVEVPWQHWKLARTKKSICGWRSPVPQHGDPISTRETWPILMGSLAGCKAKTTIKHILDHTLEQ